MSGYDVGLARFKMLVRAVILLIFCSFVNSCEQSPTPPTSLPENTLTGEVKIPQLPKGDEVIVTIKFFKPRRAVLTVRNLSSATVFVPFLPTTDSGWSKLACEGLEKYIKETNEYLETGCSIGGLGFHPLEARKSLKFLIWVPDSGRYRVNFKYYIDRQVVDQLNSFYSLSETEKEIVKVKSEKTGKDVVSSSIDL